MNQGLFYIFIISLIINFSLQPVGSEKRFTQRIISEIRSFDSIESFGSVDYQETGCKKDLLKIPSDTETFQKTHMSLDAEIKIQQEVRLIKKLRWIYKYFLDDSSEDIFGFFVYLANRCSYYSSSLIDSKKIMIEKRLELKKLIPNKYIDDYAVMVNFINQPVISSSFFYLLGVINIIFKECRNEIYYPSRKVIQEYFCNERIWLLSCLPDSFWSSIESLRLLKLRLDLQKLIEKRNDFFDL